MFSIVPQLPSIGETLGAALGTISGAGLQQGLNRFYQQQESSRTASGLADMLNLDKNQKINFVETFKNIPAKDQLAQLEKFALTQAYSQFNEPSSSSADFIKEEIEEPIAFQPPTAQEKTQGFPFKANELPPRTKKIPPFGPLAAAAKIQQNEIKENRTRNEKYSEPYQNISSLKMNLNKLEEAKRLIEKGNISSNVIQRAIAGILEGQESPIAEIFKTQDQQKLFYLLRDALKPKDIGGSNPSTREVLISMSAIPGYLKGKEANKYIINRMIDEAQKNLKKGELISSLGQYDSTMEPAQFRGIVEKKLESFFPEKVSVRLPDGRIGKINRNRLDDFISKGAEVINE